MDINATYVPKVTISHKNIPKDHLMKEWENILIPYLIPSWSSTPIISSEAHEPTPKYD